MGSNGVENTARERTQSRGRVCFPDVPTTDFFQRGAGGNPRVHPAGCVRFGNFGRSGRLHDFRSLAYTGTTSAENEPAVSERAADSLGGIRVLRGMLDGWRLGEDGVKDVTVYIGEPAFDAVVVEAELFVIDSEEVQCGGVEVVAVGWFFSCARAERVGASVGASTSDSAACHPCGEGGCVVVSPFSLRGWLASELGGADHEGAVEEAARSQIGQQGCGAGVEDCAPVAVVADEVFVAIPVGTNFSGGCVFCTAEDLDEPDATFDESAGEEALPTERPDFGML